MSEGFLHFAPFGRTDDGAKVLLWEVGWQDNLERDSGELAAGIRMVPLHEPDPFRRNPARLTEPEDVDTGAGGERGQEEIEGSRCRAIAAERSRLIGLHMERTDVRIDAFAARKCYVNVFHN